MDISTHCFVCEKLLSSRETAIVKEKGIARCITSSKKRKDNKYKLLEDKTSIVVHDVCRKSYNQDKRIEAAQKSLETPSTSRHQRSDFDFKSNCLFCGSDASPTFVKREMKKPVNKRNVVRLISTISVKDTILSTAKTRDDEWGAIVTQRIVNEIDLVAAEGRYHQSCFSKFLLKKNTENLPGRPENPSVIEVINFISAYIENNREECQFSLRELVAKYEGDLPSEKTIKKN